MLELAISLAVFLLLASIITLAVGSSSAAQHRQRLSTAGTAALDAAIGQLADASYDSLVGDTFIPPSPCSTGPVGDAATSCLHPLGPAAGQMVVHWADVVSSGSGGSTHVQLTATATLSDGQSISVSQTVNAPAAGYSPGQGEVRVALNGSSGYNPASLGTPLLLLDSSGNQVAAANVSAGADGTGVALFHVPSGSCFPGAACHLGLRTGPAGAWLPATASRGGVALAAASVIGPQAGITAVPGALSEAGATLYSTGSAALTLTATNSAVPAAGNSIPAAGSVCLWLGFNDGIAQRAVPFCDTANPTSIVAATYSPDPTNPAVTLALPVGQALAVSADDPDGTCPQASGMVGDTTSGWVAAAVCTSWTWGVPSTWTTAGTTTNFVGASLTLSPATVTSATVTWSDKTSSGAAWSAASPAAGYSGKPTWGKPRQSAGCAFDGSCLSLGTQVPETTLCPNQNCLSIAHYSPQLTSPANGPAMVPTVYASSSSTSFTLSVADPDTDTPTVALKVTVISAPTQGSVSFNGLKVTNGQVLVSGAASPWSASLTYNEPPGLVGTDTMTVSIDGGQGIVTTSTIGFYQKLQAWSLTAAALTAAQNSTNASLSVTVTGVDGNPYAGAALSATSDSPITFTGATSATNGTASLPLSVGAASAGAHTVTVTTGSVTGTTTLTVTPVLATLTAAAGPLTEGQSEAATFTTKDAAGAAYPAAPVATSVSGGASTGAGIHPSPSDCLTDSTGTCTVTLNADSSAPAGPYSLTGTSSGVSGTVTVNLAPSPAHITGSVSIAQGASGTLAATVDDGTGAAMAGVTVNFSATGLTLSSSSAVSSSSGVATVTVSVPTATAAGNVAVSVSAGGYHTTLEVTVTPVAAKLVANGPATSVGQGSAATGWVTVDDDAGNPMAGVTVSLSPSAGLHTATTTISSSPLGQADITVAADSTTPAGTGYQVSASSPGLVSVVMPVTVTQTPTSAGLTGSVPAGGSGTVTLVVLDGAGAPMAGAAYRVSAPPGITVTGPNNLDTSGQAVLSVNASGVARGTYVLGVTVGSVTLNVALNVS